LVEISKVVTEYQVKILENKQGKRFIVEFPEGVNSPIQFGVVVKNHAFTYTKLIKFLPTQRELKDLWARH